VLALLGIYILAREKQGGAQIEGDMVAIISAVTFSAYAILSKWARRDLSNSIMSSRMYFAGAIFFLLGAILSGAPLLPVTDKGLIGIALLTVFPTLMGHGIFTLVMNHIPLYVLSLGKLIEPGIAAISAYFLFAESLSMAALASSALIVSAVVLVVMKKNK
jgi:drug/metabolite transporter (DMT)-like permease